MYQSPCHNSLESITSIITKIQEIVLVFMHQFAQLKQVDPGDTFGYRGIYIWNHISQN